MMRVEPEQDRRWSELMTQAQDGDGQAYEALLLEVSAALRPFIRGRAGVRDGAEDVLQEVLLSIHESRHTFDPRRSFASWAFAIAKHRIGDHWRAASRRTRRETTTEGLESRMETAAREQHISEEMTAALSGLPSRQREVVRLLKLEGFSIKEVAQKLGISQAYVKVTAHRGYKALRRRLGSEP